MFTHSIKRANYLFASALLLLSSAFAPAQNPVGAIADRGTIRGTITDANRNAVEFATIMLLKSTDSTLIKGTVADAGGLFKLENVVEGSYLVAASQVGFQKTYSQVFKLNAGQTLALPEFHLPELSNQLNEVNVVAQKPFIEQQIDKTVVNVENSVVAAGNSALEVLERSPGVTVDRDGNISLKGKADVRVMIDGKPTYLSNQDLANLLRNMQASQLATIEIMTNPPAKYDAAGNAGIINIRLKKAQNMGLNGSVTLGYGYGMYGKQNGSLNLNYRQNKWNLFGTYSANRRLSWREQNITRVFREGDQVSAYFDQTAENFQRSHNQSIKAGADYFVSKNTTIGVLLNGSAGRWGQTTSNVTDIYKGMTLPDKQTLTNSVTSQPWNNLASNVNFKHTFDTLGSSGQPRELTADLDYAFYNNNNDQTFDIRNLDALGNPLTALRTDMGFQAGKVDIYSAKLDYVHPFSKTAKFEAGLKTSFVTTDNDMKFFIRLQSDAPSPDSLDRSRTNQFVYRENINAAYINYSRQFKKTGVQLGLRLEHTTARGHQITTDSVFTRNYLNLFPSMFVRHELNKKNSLGFSYSYRIDRPDYGSLNPFQYFLDPYTYGQGNPYLKPQFTHAFEGTHTFGGFLTTTLNFSRTNDIMTDVLRQNDLQRVTFQTRDNIGYRQNMGLAVSASFPVTKWWTATPYLNLSRNRYVGQLLGADLDQSFVSVQGNLQNQFTFSKNWSAELGGFYTNGFLEGILVGKPMGQISAGVQRQLWNKKASIRLNVRDIFWTQYFRGSVRYQNLDVFIKSRWENRVANLTFSYRFGNTKVQAARRRSTGLESEAGRVNQNN
ncbi:MAG: TonB-dependent receptor [Cytophagaceae bacterium]|nr:TonB-dependent receptor [Cytophagaceae bacterium]